MTSDFIDLIDTKNPKTVQSESIPLHMSSAFICIHTCAGTPKIKKQKSESDMASVRIRGGGIFGCGQDEVDGAETLDHRLVDDIVQAT